MDIFFELQNSMFIKRLVARNSETEPSPVFDLHILRGPKVTFCPVKWIEVG